MTQLPPADTILAIDIGNSRIALGLSDSDGLHDIVRVPTDRPDTWREPLEKAWSAITEPGGRAVVVASVVPGATGPLVHLVEDVCGVTPLLVGGDLPLPLRLQVDNQDEVGVDRVCNAAAAHERVQGACVIASFGTAITIDCVSPDGHFLGGAILPGLALSSRALHEHTAQLPEVEPALPASPFGKNTHDAIAAGVAYGAAGALREIVERFATDLGQWPPLIITGGDAALIANLTDFVDAVVPDLCLMGIALAYRQAAGKPHG